MRLCIVGIGGCGGHLAERFLQNQDISLFKQHLGEHVSFGGVKGLWLEADVTETRNLKSFGPLENGFYPGFFIPHDVISSESKTAKLIKKRYGSEYDLKKQGYMRQAEFLKAIFEIFDSDENVKREALLEYRSENPILRAAWHRICDYTTLKCSKNNDIVRSAKFDTDDDKKSAAISEQDSEKATENGSVKISEVEDERADVLEQDSEKATETGSVKISEVDEDEGADVSVQKTHNTILRNIMSVAHHHIINSPRNNIVKSEMCDGILFIVSLGGGTGTGFVNPITRYIKEETSAYPVFVLGVLTEEGMDDQQRAKEPKRSLGATISLYDLMTKKVGEGVDGIILVDNQIMVKRFGLDYSAINAYIYQAMRPFVAGRHYPNENVNSLPMREKFVEGLSPSRSPILVPCYFQEKRHKDPEKDLVRNALSKGKLFDCDPRKAEKVYVFTRGFVNKEKIVSAVSQYTGLSSDRIEPWRKLGENHMDEILILLRNPYGEERGCEVKGTLEHRLHRVIRLALEYMNDPESNLVAEWMPEETTKRAIKSYFYGEDGMQKLLDRGLKNIENGEKPFFLSERNIFESSPRDSSTSSASGSGGKVDEAAVRKIVEQVLTDRGYAPILSEET